MSSEKKYIKYKTKYIDLKYKMQFGGSKLCTKCNNKLNTSNNILDIDNLTTTPSMNEIYGYNVLKEIKENNSTYYGGNYNENEDEYEDNDNYNNDDYNNDYHDYDNANTTYYKSQQNNEIKYNDDNVDEIEGGDNYDSSDSSDSDSSDSSDSSDNSDSDSDSDSDSNVNNSNSNNNDSYSEL